MTMKLDDTHFMAAAFEQAKKSYDEGGIPVGAVLVEGGKIVAAGHNRRVQNGNPIAHGEMDCLQNAGRRPRYDTTAIYTTLSPCMMCAGTIVQFGVKHVVIGENINFGGNEEFLRQRGVRVDVINDRRCSDLMARFIKQRPELWNEDIAGGENVGVSKPASSE